MTYAERIEKACQNPEVIRNRGLLEVMDYLFKTHPGSYYRTRHDEKSHMTTVTLHVYENEWFSSEYKVVMKPLEAYL